MPGLTPAIEAAGREAFDRRLDPAGPAPLAVGVSGGADSLLTLLSAHAWAQRHGRRLQVLTVNHRLQAGSAAWTRRCGQLAAGLGLDFHALAWDGPKPAAGLPAAARAARHRLLAAAAREAGARVLLLGHTGSDVAEGEAMRAAGTNIGSLREWSPSPAWPQGRGLFCLRPLLDLSRGEVRHRLAAAGWDWIDDPANDDPRYGRARARIGLGESVGPRLRAGDRRLGAAAQLDFDRAGFVAPPLELAADPRLLQMLLLCVSGGEAPARGARVEALARDPPPAATLGGCRLSRDGGRLLIARELGRRPPPPMDLPRNEPVVWDGRFEIVAEAPGLGVRPLRGLARRLPPAGRAALAAVPAMARPSLPALVREGDQTVTCPFLAEAPGVRIEALAAQRFAAACGLIAHESAIGGGAHGAFTLDILSWSPETEKGPLG